MALGNCIATMESNPNPCAREAPARWEPGAAWGCSLWLWEHHFSREDLSMARSKEN